MNGYDYAVVSAEVVFIALWLYGDRKWGRGGFTTYRVMVATLVAINLVVFVATYMFDLPLWLRLVPVLPMIAVLFGGRRLNALSVWIDTRRRPPHDIRQR